MNRDEINRIRMTLKTGRTLFSRRGHIAWMEEMGVALESLDRGDLSFVDALYGKVAPTGEVEQLFITESELCVPPVTEEEANRLNQELADVINELAAALEPLWDRRHNQTIHVTSRPLGT